MFSASLTLTQFTDPGIHISMATIYCFEITYVEEAFVITQQQSVGRWSQTEWVADRHPQPQEFAYG